MRIDTEKLLKEEQELEKSMFTTPTEEATTEPEAGKDDAEQKEAPTEAKELVAPKPESVTDEPQSRQGDAGENWELRYKNLRSSRDDKLYEAKSKLAVALDKVQSLQHELTQALAQRQEVTTQPDMFTAEEREALGDTTVEAMTKVTERATKAATEPLKKQLEEERKEREAQRKREAELTRQEAYNIFLNRISTAVPNWEEINYDPAFKTWMNGEDIDGTPRKTYFAEAESKGNAALIIRYMKEYEAQKPAPKEDKLAGKITPTGEGSGATQAQTEESVEWVTRAEINQFYADLNRGLYKGRDSEAKAIEAQIDLATMEGRIR